nr:restriction endonuclease subunit S [uncultured Acidovorax sp.]
MNPLQFPDEEFDLYSIPAFDAGQPEIVLGAEIGSTKQIIQPNDVLLSKIVPHIRRAWVVGDDRGRRLIGSGEWIVFRSEKVFPSYLRHVLVGDPFHQQFMQTVSGVGGSLLRARPAFVASIQIPLPPLVEQRRIAAILDQAETLRTQRRTALALLDSLTQSLFLDMFGDPVANPKGWPTPKFGEVGTLDRGISKHRPRNAPELLGGKHPLVQTGEVANCDGYIRSYTSTYSDLGLRQSKMWPAGTLCITIAANIAKTGILSFDACFPDSVVGFRADDPATVEYVRVWLSFLQKALEDSAPESAQKNINLAILRGLSIPLPPLSLQQTFATRIASIEALKATHRRALTALDALFASLQQRAFSGELTPAAPRSPAQSLEQLQQLEASIGQEALIFIAKRIPDGDLYNSLKAIYFADRHHLEHHGRQIYNETYCALPHGPVPQSAYDATRVLIGERMFSDFDDDAMRAALRRNDKKLTALRDADFSKLSRSVVESLEWAIRYCSDMKFGQTKTASHDSAYERTPKNEAIPLQYIIDTLPPEARQRHWNL